MKKKLFSSSIKKNKNVKPRISIGIPVYNGEKTIKRALDGIKIQTFKDYEVIVSDDCSTDKTATICREYCRKNPRFHYVRQKDNLGWTGNLAYLFNNTQAPYFVCLSHDDYYKNKGYLEKLYRQSEKGYALVYPNVLKIIRTKNGKEKKLTKKKSLFDNKKSRFEKHLTIVKNYYIGYQIFGVMNRDAVAECFGLLFQNYYYRKDGRDYLDEEPFLHFVFSRYDTYFEPSVYYVKDMSNSMYFRMSSLESLLPIFWNTLACIGIFAEAPYTTTQKLRIIFVRILRGIYMMIDLVVKDVRLFIGYR